MKKARELFNHKFESSGLFQSPRLAAHNFPIQHIDIDWERLMTKRPMEVDTVDEIPTYLLKPEDPFIRNDHRSGR